MIVDGELNFACDTLEEFIHLLKFESRVINIIKKS